MEEQIIQLETAILAKEKGFKLDKLYYYNKKPLTQSLLQKWLREKYQLDIEVGVYTRPHYCVIIVDKHSSIHHIERDTPIETYEEHPLAFLSYEEALEKGLEEALKLVDLM